MRLLALMASADELAVADQRERRSWNGCTLKSTRPAMISVSAFHAA